MPTYRITILDENWKEVKEKIEENFKRELDSNERIKSSRLIKPFRSLFKKVIGIDFDIYISWNWIEDRVCIFNLTVPVPLKEEFYDKEIKKLSEWGKVSIERIDSKGNVIAKVI
jgi:hypothetical protein